MKLKPCPFCGMKVMAYREHPKLGFAVECGRFDCGAMTKYFVTKDLAIEAWNRREPIDKIVEQLEKQITEKNDWQFSNAEIAYWNKGIRKAIEIVKSGGAV